jgi:flavin reductase (DIM6/NTAB) family NADH-FMN oxidoreductase RutF
LLLINQAGGHANMSKKNLGNQSLLYPYPVTILGTMVNGKPNFMTLAFVGIVNSKPGMIALGCGKRHLTNAGIKENQTFSINLPSTDMIKLADYIGCVSGSKIDKSELFKVFYGKLGTAPMIEECPLCLECKVLKILDLGGLDDIIIGEIIESYCEEKCLTDNLPDLEKLKPFLLSMYENRYFATGEYLGKAWKIGLDYKKD